MPEICLYEPWTMKTAMPEEIESLLKTNGKKRISYEENDCSRYNTRTQGKSARLHPPTCSAMLKLYEIENNRENGAAGIQRVHRILRLEGYVRRIWSLYILLNKLPVPFL